MMLLHHLLLASFFLKVHSQEPCVSRAYADGIVCVCNSQQCDTVPQVVPVESPSYLAYTSNLEGLRFEKKPGTFEQSTPGTNQILVESTTKYQEILGWGGAFTDSAGINIGSLEENVQDKLLSSYFSTDGIEYSTARVPIGGTDFSTHAYSYHDVAEDADLKNFTLAEEDFLYKIPLIKRAKELNSNLQLFSSAWTAPKWMKTNGEYDGQGYLKTEYYQSWADYFVKFLDAYAAEGVKFWGITTGNEPNTALLPYNPINIVGWIADDLGTWVANNLGPALRNSNNSDIQIMLHDDQRMYLPLYADIALSVENATKYVDGIAFHWYSNPVAPASLLDETHNHHPEKFILSTEACNVNFLAATAVHLGSWDRGEYYSIDIIEDLNHWTAGWIDWNLVLDLDGGPTYINNNVDAPIIVNATAGEFYKQPMFYHLGHFSKFLPRGSVRIQSSTNLDDEVMVVAFERPDNGTAIVILNRKNESVPLSLVDQRRGTAQLDLSKRSITTLLYW